MSRKGLLLAAFVAALTLNELTHYSLGKRITLKTGIVETTEPSQNDQDASFGVAARSSSVGGSESQLALHLFSYENDNHAKDIKDAIEAQGGCVLSYLPVNNLRVAATPASAVSVATSFNAEVATLEAKHKIAADWLPILDAVKAAATAAQSAAQPTANEASKTAAYLAQLRATSILSGLRTYQNPSSSSAAEAVQYGIRVELPSCLPADALNTAVEDWPDALAAAVSSASSSPACSPALASAPDAGAGSAARLVVYLCQGHLAQGVAWLAARSFVSLVAPLRVTKTSDVYANVLMQTGTLSQAQYDSAPSPGGRPYWDAGLQGQGEILGITDSGIDVENCYFQDPRFAGNYSAALANRNQLPTLGILSYAAIPEHRKVIQYALVPGGDGVDFGGHGTLCSSTAAGAVLANSTSPLGGFSLTEATGAAPAAKISFVDTEHAAYSSIIWVPDDLYNTTLPAHKKAKAKILSDSWGAAGAPYDATAQSYDRFLWENPDVTSLIAAGNNGDSILAPFTVSSPSIAKNVISVGAGFVNPPLSGPDDHDYDFPVLILTITSKRGGEPLQTPIFPIRSPNGPRLSPIIIEKATPTRLILANPPDGCQKLVNPKPAVKGSVVVVIRRYCNLDKVARNVKAAGGVAVMLVSDTVSDLNPPLRLTEGGKEVNGTTPIVGIPLDIGVQLVASLGSGDSATMSGAYAPMTIDSVVYFSSWGPTDDGRMKPDIIAPGVGIVSSPSHLTEESGGDMCTTEVWDGTSAATPLAAGTIALARQYFREGFYPSGSRNDSGSSPFTPSGMLLKAVAIAGAKSMEGGVAFAAGMIMGPSPDFYQGWGRLNLAGALPLRNATDPGVRLQVADWGNFTKTGEVTSLKGLTATGNGPITIVLTWYDYPADENAFPSLVNDLDLVVVVNGTSYLGNDQGARNPVADDRNTVERVLLASPPANAALEIRVRASSLGSRTLDPNTPQRWAVAVVGAFNGTIQSPLNPAWTAPKAARGARGRSAQAVTAA